MEVSQDSPENKRGQESPMSDESDEGRLIIQTDGPGDSPHTSDE